MTSKQKTHHKLDRCQAIVYEVQHISRNGIVTRKSTESERESVRRAEEELQ